MKFSAKITDSQISRLTAAKQQLEKHLRHSAEAEKKIVTHTKQLATLDGEHEELQKAAHGGIHRQAITDLQACHVQRATVAAHIETAHAQAADVGVALRVAVDGASTTVCGVIGQNLQAQLTDAVGEANRPFWHRESDARHRVHDCDAVRELGNFLNPPMPFDVPALARLGRRLAATIEAVLKGGELWAFTARADWADGMPAGE